MDEAMREIIKGIRAHYVVAGEPPSDRLTKAIEAVGASARGASDEQSIRRYHIRLWALASAPPAGARAIRSAGRKCCRARTESASSCRSPTSCIWPRSPISASSG
jgi:hypothetical protein